MMGAGKSTVGRALARLLGCPFVDTDAEIERRADRSIPEIFSEEGEAAFRRRERAEVERWARREAVVALGGGAIAQDGMRERLRESGTVVYLRARPATLLARLGDCRSRPLLAGLDAAARGRRLEALLEERSEAYESAQVVIDTDGRAAREIATGLMARLAGLEQTG